ncbi:hypothetical protein [Sphingomonas bacterium]|uniref:hypothetical protein n=1 Tax=Sphingomonas bacterium TaxID=1895847 RepID=UPI00260DB7CA|nr:hypothetical protein [Sphingomonas bacterium]MDB5679829.1 hypothetical protein [Sphingomonas bacterium]
MTDTPADNHWGERQLKRRDRQQWLLRGSLIALGIVFVIGVRSLVAAHAIGQGTTALFALAFVAIVAVVGWVSWQRQDEVRRRIAINAYAVMGLTCLMLMPLAGGIGPLLGLRQPFLVVYVIAVLTVPAVVVFQRIRG